MMRLHQIYDSLWVKAKKEETQKTSSENCYFNRNYATHIQKHEFNNTKG